MPDEVKLTPSTRSSSGETESLEAGGEGFDVNDKVVQGLLDMKVLLHTKLELPKEVGLPPYRLLGGFSPETPELWGHALATLASEWCCAYLNTEGGILILGADSDGLITVMMLPVFTPVAQFDPYYVLIIRVRKGPFPCYLNPAHIGYSGDFVLKKLTDEEVETRMSEVDASRMASYLQSYRKKDARHAACLGQVIENKGRMVFDYSAHWSHPPLTLIPEAATTGLVGKQAIVNQPAGSLGDDKKDRKKTPQQLPQQPAKKQRLDYDKQRPLSGLMRGPQQSSQPNKKQPPTAGSHSPQQQQQQPQQQPAKKYVPQQRAPLSGLSRTPQPADPPSVSPPVRAAPLCRIIPHVPVVRAQTDPTVYPPNAATPAAKKPMKKVARKAKK